MKKLLFLTMMTLGLTVYSSAQGIGKLKFSVGPELMFSAGDFFNYQRIRDRGHSSIGNLSQGES